MDLQRSYPEMRETSNFIDRVPSFPSLNKDTKGLEPEQFPVPSFLLNNYGDDKQQMLINKTPPFPTTSPTNSIYAQHNSLNELDSTYGSSNPKHFIPNAHTPSTNSSTIVGKQTLSPSIPSASEFPTNFSLLRMSLPLPSHSSEHPVLPLNPLRYSSSYSSSHTPKIPCRLSTTFSPSLSPPPPPIPSPCPHQNQSPSRSINSTLPFLQSGSPIHYLSNDSQCVSSESERGLSDPIEPDLDFSSLNKPSEPNTEHASMKPVDTHEFPTEHGDADVANTGIHLYNIDPLLNDSTQQNTVHPILQEALTPTVFQPELVHTDTLQTRTESFSSLNSTL